MTNAIIPYADVERMGAAVAKSGLFGIKTPEQAIALMLIAQAEGLHPAIAARDYHVIQGRPALKADAMLARFLQGGGKVQWHELTDEKVSATFTHAAGGAATITWTIAEAKRIGLAGKDNWKNYPRAMLRSRVVSEGIRTVFPIAVVGVYTPEEVQDFDHQPAAPVIEPPKIPQPPAPAPPAPPVIEGKAEMLPPGERNEWPLMVPNMDQPYTICTSAEEWRDYFNGLVEKIERSRKYQEAEKAEKVARLLDSNRLLYEKLPDEIRNQIQTTIEA